MNPRYRFKPVYSLSRRAPSAGSDTSPHGQARLRQTIDLQDSPDQILCQEYGVLFFRVDGIRAVPWRRVQVQDSLNVKGDSLYPLAAADEE